MYKVGIGYDVHSLEIGKPFILGGIKLNHRKGSVGHSDADVLIPVSYTHLRAHET